MIYDNDPPNTLNWRTGRWRTTNYIIDSLSHQWSAIVLFYLPVTWTYLRCEIPVSCPSSVEPKLKFLSIRSMSTTISRPTPATNPIKWVVVSRLRLYFWREGWGWALGTYLSHETTAASDENGFPFVELLHRCQLIWITHFAVCEERERETKMIRSIGIDHSEFALIDLIEFAYQ